MRKITIAIVALIVVGLMLPTVFSTNANSVVVTYGETTNANPNYKASVNEFFKTQANVDLNQADVKIITASDVNKVSGSITQKTYGSDQIFSCALVDLNSDGNINVKVDSSKITTITPKMYASALKSAGVPQANVYVTSPVPATGESALAGILNSYEVATNTVMPDEVKQAATDEITVQSDIVNSNTSDVSADEISNLVSEVKVIVINNNITDHNEIVNIIKNYTINNNINLSDVDIENLANIIGELQNVSDQAGNYENQVSSNGGNDNILNKIASIL